jgi:hypothetical protein
MAFQVVGTESTPGFTAGPDEDEYRVAEPRWRVRALPTRETGSAAGWVAVIRRLQAEPEITLPG